MTMTYLEHLAVIQLNQRLTEDKLLVMMVESARERGEPIGRHDLKRYREARQRIETDTRVLAQITEQEA